MTTGALEVGPFTAAGAMDMHPMHAWRCVLYCEDDLHHMPVAAIGDFVECRCAGHAACALNRRTRGLHR